MTPEELKALDRASWSEDTFQKHVINLARGLGWRVAHFRRVRIQRKGGACYYATPVQADGAGFPDLILVRPPRLLAVELKVKKNKASEEQHAWLNAFKECRVESFLWKPDDWDRIARTLTGDGE